jgi:hypothetical protein
MTFDTPQQANYLLDLLDRRRDAVTDRISKLEDSFTDMVALHESPRYKALDAERDMNAILTVRAMEAKRQLENAQMVLSN